MAERSAVVMSSTFVAVPAAVPTLTDVPGVTGRMKSGLIGELPPEITGTTESTPPLKSISSAVRVKDWPLFTDTVLSKMISLVIKSISKASMF